jgi:hypothetical protein
MELATSLNHLGVGLYHSNRGGDAYDMFRRAVVAMLDMDPLLSSWHLLVQDEIMRQALGKALPVQLSAYDGTGGLLSLFPRPTNLGLGITPIHMVPVYTPASTFPPRSKSSSLDTEVPYLYSEVFSMEVLNNHPLCLQFDVATSVVLYNMALVLQRGMVPHSHKSLEQALMLYSLAGRLLWEKVGPLHIQCDKMTSKMYMAIMNNTGYVLHELGLFDWSRLFFVRLKEFLRSLAPSATRAEQKERDEFHLNVIVFYRSATAAPAA